MLRRFSSASPWQIQTSHRASSHPRGDWEPPPWFAPADANNTVLIGLKPFAQQLRRNDADRAAGNRTFHLELRTRRKGFPPARRIGRQGRRGAAERKIVTATNVLFNIHHPGKAVLDRNLDNPRLSGLRQESVHLYARNSQQVRRLLLRVPGDMIQPCRSDDLL